MKIINLDMDGTLVDFYGVPNWLEMLEKGDPTPYAIAKPLFSFSLLARFLNRLQKQGYQICIISWLSKTGTKEYNEVVKEVKLSYLAKHLPSVKFDKISIVPYGTPKSTCGQGILFDDEERNRKEWKGVAYDEKNLLQILKNLLNPLDKQVKV